jgi:hypothetical protein
MVGMSLTRHLFVAFLVLVRAPFSIQKEMDITFWENGEFQGGGDIFFQIVAPPSSQD